MNTTKLQYLSKYIPFCFYTIFYFFILIFFRYFILEILREKFLETAPIYKTTPGLIRKNYISDLKNNIAGGIYCFDNMLNAKRWFDNERIEWITNRYSKPKLKFYENFVVVDNESKKIISNKNM